MAETSLKASTHQCNYLKKENSHLQEDLDKARAKVYKVCKHVSIDEAVLSFSDQKRRKYSGNKYRRDLSEDVTSFNIVSRCFPD